MQTILDDNKATLSRIEAQLQKLYGMGIVYSRFQNIVAMNTIREYIEMGICDKLEGSDGAYAVYLQDLRTEKICGSIDDLKRATVQALSQIAFNQERLIREVREVDNDIRVLEQDVNRNLAGLNQNMQGIQQDISQGNKLKAEQMQMIDRHMQGIERTVQNAAYNDYIQKRIQSTDYYLSTHYRAPNE